MDNPADFRTIREKVIRLVRAASSRHEAMESTVAELKSHLPHFDWVGIYLLEGETLELGPYRGEPSPHTRIPLNRGLCGAAATAKATMVIPDVHADPRYLACSIKTRSEIVVPIMDGSRCLGEIDVDSHTPDAFGDEDRIMLESIAGELALKWTGA